MLVMQDLLFLPKHVSAIMNVAYFSGTDSFNKIVIESLILNQRFQIYDGF